MLLETVYELLVPLSSETYRLWLPPLLAAVPIHHLLVLELFSKTHKAFWAVLSKLHEKGSPIYLLEVRKVADRVAEDPSGQTGVT